MKTKKNIAGWMAAVCVAALQTVGGQSDSNELPTREAKLISVSTQSIGRSEESKSNSPASDAAPKRKAYYLRPGDMLSLEVVNPGDTFTNPVTIDNQGTVNLNLLGWVNVEKLTVEQAQDMIKEKYMAEYFRNPRVNLRLVSKAKLRFKILGQVAQPGFYEVPPGLEVDLLDAIAIAGGYTRLANKVTYKYFTQNDADGQTGERIETYKIRELKRTPGAKIPVLNGDDTIVVGESIF